MRFNRLIQLLLQNQVYIHMMVVPWEKMWPSVSPMTTKLEAKIGTAGTHSLCTQYVPNMYLLNKHQLTEEMGYFLPLAFLFTLIAYCVVNKSARKYIYEKVSNTSLVIYNKISLLKFYSLYLIYCICIFKSLIICKIYKINKIEV